MPNDTNWNRLQADNYQLVTSASIANPDGTFYSAYLLTDLDLEPQVTNGYIGATLETGQGICRVAFYRWKSGEPYFMADFGESDAPWGCYAIHWSEPVYQPDDINAALTLNGYWSDINANGLPEFSIMSSKCWACHDWYGITTQFYEFRSEDEVVELTDDLPGVLLPCCFVHSLEPLTLRARTAVSFGYYYEAFDVDLLLGWEDGDWVNVTPRHADEYHQLVHQEVLKLKTDYGHPSPWLPVRSLVGILALTNAAELPRSQALATYLEVSDPAHWSASEPGFVCWLQISRAYAQLDYETGIPFRTYPTLVLDLGPGLGIPLDELAPGLDPARFDLSACQ